MINEKDFYSKMADYQKTFQPMAFKNNRELLDFCGNREHGIKELYDKEITPMFREIFGMKTLDNKTWFTDYENHVRKAIHFRALKGTSYEIDFGYNFDFIQIIKSEKLQYNRTEKSVILHIRDVPYPYAADTDKELWDCSYQIERYFKDKNQGIQHTRTVLNNVIPIIYNYFLRIQTYDDMINEIDRRISLDNPIYYMMYPDQQYIKIWLTAKKGEKDKAFQLLNECPYLSKESKNMIMTKLKSW